MLYFGLMYGGICVVFILGNSVAATSMTSCRFGFIVVNGWILFVIMDVNVDVGIVCVVFVLKVGMYNFGLGIVCGVVGDLTTSSVTFGMMSYVVYAESA